MKNVLLAGHADGLVCDAHMHVFQMARAAKSEQLTVSSDIPAGLLQDYLEVARRLGVRRYVVVQPSHFGTDNRTTLLAVDRLGPEARAVVIPSSDASKDDIAQFDSAGGVAARFFLLRDTGLRAEHLKRTADLIHPFGWHLEVQCNAELLPRILPLLWDLPVPSVVDHIGLMPPGTRPDDSLFSLLLQHLKTGRGWVKLSAPYHNAGKELEGYEILRPQIQALAGAAADRLVWASNWPHVQFKLKPDDLQLARQILALLPDPDLARQVLVENAARLYRFDTSRSPASPPVAAPGL